MLSYLVGMKRRNSRRSCARVTLFVMYLSPLMSAIYLLVNHFEKPVHIAVRHFSCCFLLQAAVWLCLLFHFIQIALGVLRFVRNRRLRGGARQDKSTSDKKKFGNVEPTA